MAAEAPCREELLAFLHGSLSDTQAAEMIDRIEQFPAARALLEELSSEDSLAVDLKELLPVTPFAGEPELQAALAKAVHVDAMMETLSQNSATEATQDFGQRSTGKSALGKSASAAPAAQLREYSLLEKLGEGGMGAVYKARHTRLDKIVALKVLAADRMTNAESVKRFNREMMAVGRLDHPNIVRATDAGEVDGTHFLVMEYVAGKDLSRIANENGPLRVADACEAVRQAAVGLQHAHEHGLVHRDVKPGNLMLSGSSVKILDMGLARLHAEQELGELTSHGDVLGTVDYMAPEQAADTHAADIRADIYSLGCTLYKLLTGAAPFTGPAFSTTISKLLGHSSQRPKPIGEIRPDVPARLVAVIDKMLAKSKADRFATPGELAVALEPYCRGANLPALLTPPEIPRSGSLAVTSHSLGTIAQVESRPAGYESGHSGRGRRLILATAGLAAMVAAAFVIRVMTDRGELVITSPESDIHATIKRHGQPVKDLVLTMGENHVNVRSGDVEIELTGANADSFTVSKNQTVTLSRGGSEVVTIERRPAGMPESPVVTSDPDRAAANWALAHGGKILIRIRDDGAELGITAKKDLPADPFEITEIDLRGANKVLTDADLAQIGRLNGLHTIRMTASGITDAGVDHLCTFPNLTDLDLPSVQISEGGLARLVERLSHLRGLVLDGATVTNAGMKRLSTAEGLLYLSLHRLPITDAGLRELGGLTRLRFLMLGGTRVSGAGLRYLRELNKLQELNLNGSLVDDDGLKHLEPLTNLASLDLTATRVTDAGLRILERYSNLTFLGLPGTKVTEEGVNKLAAALPGCTIGWNGRTIEPKLAASANSEPVVAAKPLKSVDRLVAEQVLAIGGKVDWFIGAQPGNASMIAELPKEPFKLHVIMLEGANDLPEGLLAEIGRLRHLQAFYANNTRLDDNDLKQIGNLESLTYLRIANTQVTSAGLAALTSLKRLRTLYVHDLQVSDRGAKSIAQLDELQDLWIAESRLTDAGLAELAKLRDLRTLDLTGASVTDAGLPSLSAMAELEELWLRETHIDGSGFVAIAGLPRLRSLSLRGTNVGDEHLPKLGPLPWLHVLDLRGTKITDHAVATLSSMKSLTEIDLDGTALSVAAREALGRSLPRSNLNGDTIAANREAAEWVLKNGGGLSLIVNGDYVWQAKQLPNGPFDVAAIGFFPTAPAVDDSVLAKFARLSNLRDLYIPETPAGNAGLMRLGDLKELRQIDASVSKMDDRSLASFSGCENLRILTLRGVQAGRAPIAGFDKLPLENFQFHFGPVTDDFLACLPCQRLVILSFLGCKNVSDGGLKHLQAAKRLERLTLVGTSVTDTGLAYLAQLRDLRSLLLGDTRISSAGLTSLSGLKELEVLDLSKTLVGSDLSALAGLDRLCWLSLNDTQIADESLGHLAGLSDLDHLDLRATAVTAEGVARLQRALPQCLIFTDFPQLAVTTDPDRAAAEWLLARGGVICIRVNGTDHIPSSAKDLPPDPFEIREIDLRGKDKSLTDADLSKMGRLAGLERIMATTKDVTDDGLDQLSKFPKLVVLEFGDVHISDHGLEKIAQHLPRLRNLALSNATITDKGMRHLSTLSELVYLYLISVPITDTGLKELQGLTQMRLLGLTATRVTGAGLKHLRGMKELEMLILHTTQVDDDGLKHLEPLTNLSELNLTSTPITDAGLRNLENHSKLKFLGVNGTKVTEEGVNKLAAALPGCTIQWAGGKIEGRPATPTTPTKTARGANEAPMSIGALVGRPTRLKGLKSWTIETRQHRNAINDVAISPDNSRLATVAADGNVRLWDIPSHQLQKVFFGDSHSLYLVSWSPDGKKLAAADGMTVAYVWDVESGKRERTIPRVASGLARLAWSPDSNALALSGGYGNGGGHGVTVWDVAKDQLRFRLPNRWGTSAWSPKGDRLAVDSMKGNGGMVVVWDARTGQEKTSFQAVEEGLVALAWSPDGKFLAVAGWKSSQARILDADTGQTVQTLANPSGSPITDLAWSPQGDRFAIVGGELRIWDAATWQPLGSATPAQRGLKWSEDGQTIATLTDQGACLFNVPQRQLTTRFSVLPGTGYSLYQQHLSHRFFAWSHDAKQIALRSGPTSLGVWDTTTGGAVYSFPTKPQHWWEGLTWSHDGQMLAKSSFNGALECFDVVSGKPLKELPFAWHSLDFSPDDRLLAGIGSNGQVQICDVSSGKAVTAPFGTRSALLAWSPKREHIVMDEELKLVVRRTDSEAVAQFDELTTITTALAWSPDGEQLAIGDLDGSAIFLWHPATGARRVIVVPATIVTSLAFSADGRTLVVAQADNMLRTFDVDSLDLLSAVPFATGFGSSFSTDLTRAASLDGGMALRFCDVSQGSTSGVIMPLSADEWLAIGADGHYRGSPGVEKHLIFVAETDDGEQLILSPQEFSKQFAWRNDPTHVRLDGRRPEPPTADTEPFTDNKKVAQWAIDHGASVWANYGDTTSTFQRPAKLPDNISRISVLHFFPAPSPSVSEAELLDQLRRVRGDVDNLGLSGIPLTDAGLAAICQLPSMANLREIGGSQSEISDTGLASLVPLSQLRKVSFLNCQIKGDGLLHFHQLPKLRDLSLIGNPLTDESIKQLGGLKLERLDLQAIPSVADAGMTEIGQMTTLRYLGLTGTSISDHGWELLQGITELSSLRIGGTKITEQGLARLVRCKSLEILDLVDLPVTDDLLKQVCSLPKLEMLQLGGDRLLVSPAGLSVVNSSKLQSLHLYSKHVTDEWMESLGKLTKLRELVLLYSNVTASGVEKLHAALPHCRIEWDGGTIAGQPPATAPKRNATADSTIDRRVAEHVLAMGGTLGLNYRGSDKKAAAIGDLPADSFKITLIDLYNSPLLHSDHVALIGQLRHLRRLTLHCSRLTDADLDQIAKIPTLRVLGIDRTLVTDDGLEKLVALERLTELWLNDINISSKGAKAIGKLSRLELLSLNRTGLNDEGLAQLQRLKHLRILRLTGTRVTDQGLAALAAMANLEELLLGQSRIHGAGLASLAALPRLAILVISGTGIDDEHAPLLSRLPALRELDLSSTRLTDRAVDALSQVKTLTMINLDGTRLTDEGRKRLGEALPLSNLNERHLSATRSAAIWALEHGASLEIPSFGNVKRVADLPAGPFEISTISFDRGIQADGDTSFKSLSQLSNLKEIVVGAESTASEWLAPLERLPRLRGLATSDPELTDSELSSLASCPLRSLSLIGTDVNGECLANMRDASLETIILQRAPIGDEALAPLPKTALRTLDLFQCKGVTDAGLRYLQEAIDLEVLVLHGTSITDRGLEYLADCQQLTWLDLRCPGVFGEGLQHLAGLKRLEGLHLNNTRITDSSLAALSGLDRLCFLELTGTQVTDLGLEHLKSLTDLDLLDLGNTKVTEAGIAKLQNSLPHCTIRSDFQPDLP